THHTLPHLIPRHVGEVKEGRVSFMLTIRTLNRTRHPIKTTSSTTILPIHTALLASLPREILRRLLHLRRLPVEAIHILLILMSTHFILLTTCPEASIQKTK
ncbi:hypothetical protein BGZ52_006205, partial [Haplosporangium bisporale]